MKRVRIKSIFIHPDRPVVTIRAGPYTKTLSFETYKAAQWSSYWLSTKQPHLWKDIGKFVDEGRRLTFDDLVGRYLNVRRVTEVNHGDGTFSLMID
jgi:hypothetical protein